MKGLILYLLSLLGCLIFGTFGFVWACVAAFRAHGWGGFKVIDKKLLKMAIGRDIYGGVVCAEWFNKALIEPDAPVKFGSRWITISEVLGLNQLDRKLTMTGRRVKNFLGVFEPGHTRKAARAKKQTT